MDLSIEDRALLREVVRHARRSRRLRLEVPGLRHDELLARRIEGHLSREEGIERVEASPLSGRVLIVYSERSPFLDRLGLLAAAESPQPANEASHAEGSRAGTNGQAQPETSSEPWHAMSVDEVMQAMGSGERGLEPPEAATRLQAHGPNSMESERPRSRLEILRGQVANLPTALLLGSAVLSALLGDFFDAGAIALVVGVNAALGYRVEKENQDLLSAWRKLESGNAQVMRAGEVQTVSADELVPGDVILLRSGDVVPADARVIEVHRLSVREASLTGESEPQRKTCDPVSADTALADRNCMLFSGTDVASGHGRAVVTATGAHTEAARVRSLVEGAEAPETPLERGLRRLSHQATMVSLAAAGVSTVAGLLRGQPAIALLRRAVALGVAAIPEGLPLVSTATLVNAMSRMRSKGMVVRRVSSAETLGSVTVICADKTGTLTQNRMRLEVVEVGGRRLEGADIKVDPNRVLDDPVTTTLAAAVLNSDLDFQESEDGLRFSGSSTEQALAQGAREAGLDLAALRRAFPRHALKERDAGVHYVVSVHDHAEGGPVAFVKGAPEQVIDLCADTSGGPLDQEQRQALVEKNHALAGSGLRLLAVAWRRAGGEGNVDTLANAREGFTFLGFVGLRDPLRPGAADAVAAAARAGIRTVILTGDQRATAAAIAQQIGLPGEAIDGSELAALIKRGGPEAERRLREVRVISRVTPAQKLEIVRALRHLGEVVAMAGDGTNDAPAMRVSDVGIAVGAEATNLARQTSDIVLEGEDLRSVVDAVAEGRNAREGVNRSIRFLFSTNLSEIALMVGGALFGREPLQPLQLLWINLLSDTFPALAIGLEEGEDNVLDRHPEPIALDLFNMRTGSPLVRDAALMGGAASVAYVAGGPETAFSTLTGLQLGYALLQSRRPFALGPRSPLAGTGLAAILQLGALTLPPLRTALALRSSPLLPIAGLALGLGAPLVVGALTALRPRIKALVPAPRGVTS